MIDKSLPLIMLPILTRYLTPVEYGTLAIFQVLITFSGALISMSLYTNISRKFFVLSKIHLALYISNIAAVALCNFSLALAATGLITFFYHNPFDIPSRWIYALPLIAIMNTFNLFNLTVLRNASRPLIFGLFQITRTIVTLSIALLLIVKYHLGWQGQAYALLLSSIIAGMVGAIYLIMTGYMKLSLNRQSITEILSISLPLVPHSIGAFVITLSDRLFIDQMINKSAVALYTVGYTLGMIILLCNDAFAKAWSPWFYKTMAQAPAQDNAILRRASIYAIAIFFLAGIVSLGARFVLPYLTTNDYNGAARYVAWIAFGYAFHGIYILFFPYVIHYNKTTFLGLLTFSMALFNIFANYILILYNGAVGAAQATLLTYIITAVCLILFTKNLRRRAATED